MITRKHKIVTVGDKMQQNYRYTCIARVGKDSWHQRAIMADNDAKEENQLK